MNATLFRCFFLLFLCMPGLARALEEGTPYVVRHVIDGDTVILENEEGVRLSGINAPEVENLEHRHKGQPYGEEAKAYLAQWLEGKPVTLKFNPELKRDRHGRWLAQLYVGKEWVQEKLVREGYAVVYSFKDNAFMVAPLQKAEGRAIAGGKGVWALPYHKILSSEAVTAEDRRFHVVEGEIQQVAKVKKAVYLNFGEEWKTDFTGFIAKENVAAFEERFGELKKLKYSRVRLRGWVFSKNGPMIELTHPEQLEVVE